jgi:predicted small lipoprotein YifL
MRARNISAAVIMLLLPLLLQGCGRKGPLYLQKKPAAPVQVQQAPQPLQPAGEQTQPAQNAVIQNPVIQNTTEPAQ